MLIASIFGKWIFPFHVLVSHGIDADCNQNGAFVHLTHICVGSSAQNAFNNLELRNRQNVRMNPKKVIFGGFSEIVHVVLHENF